jgi:phospholipase/carboxylesterase
MNRIPPQVAGYHDVVPDAPARDVQAALFSRAGETARLAWFAPMHYEPNYAYPLLIWLHGDHGDQQQLKRIMPLVSMRNYAAVAPCAPYRDGPTAAVWGSTSVDVSLAEQCVLDALQQAQKKFHIHPRRIFLAGFGAGGTMAFRLAMAHPDRFAGVLSLGGEFPSGRMPFHRLEEARRVPLLLCCGVASQTYPTERVCEDLRLLHAAGMHITLRQYTCGHEITPAMLGDMDRWMMEQILTPIE